MNEPEKKYPTRENPMLLSRREMFFVCDHKSIFGPCKHPDLCTKNRMCGETFAT